MLNVRCTLTVSLAVNRLPYKLLTLSSALLTPYPLIFSLNSHIRQIRSGPVMYKILLYQVGSDPTIPSLICNPAFSYRFSVFILMEDL